MANNYVQGQSEFGVHQNPGARGTNAECIWKKMKKEKEKEKEKEKKYQ